MRPSLIALAFLLTLGLAAPASAQVVRARDTLRSGPSGSAPAQRPARVRPPRLAASPRSYPSVRSSGRTTWTPPPRYWVYRPFPYADHGDGYTFDPREEPRAAQRDGLFLGSVRIGYLLGEVGQLDVRLTAVLGIFELFARQRVLFESIAPNGVEALGLGHVGLGVRIGRSEAVRARGHLDFMHAEDGLGVLAGASVGLDVDVYFAAPWAFSLDASAGIAGSAWVLEGGLSFGILEGPVELHVGWDVIVFAPFDGDEPVPFTGPSLMIRGWAS